MQNNSLLSYNSPATEWIEGMPLGNGRLGAMVEGKIFSEQIMLNEDSVWAGSDGDRNNASSKKHIDEIRELILTKQFNKAQMLADAAFVGTPRKQAPYQLMGELHMEFVYEAEADYTGTIAKDDIPVFSNNTANMKMEMPIEEGSYYRELNIANATSEVRFANKGAEYKREYFISAPDNVMVARFSSNKKAKQQFSIALYRRFNVETSVNDNVITMLGQAGKDGVKFCTKLAVELEGENAKMRIVGEKLLIEKADTVTLRLVCQSDYRSKTYVQDAENMLKNAQSKTYEMIKTAHIADYKSFYDRMSFNITGESPKAELATDERLELVQKGATDIELANTYFNFGRYLLICSSRPNSLPANLQGIWCDSVLPTWDSKYTININTEMNYWPAEVCGLSDCHMPLLELVDRMRENGRKTAKIMYGCRGFVAHHNTDIWCDTVPLDHAWAGVWPMGAGWLSLHMWDHYKYTQDKDFLANKGYPIMKEAAEFFLDYMFEHDGVLMTGPSLSPENRFLAENGELGCVCCAPAMDTQIVTGLYKRCLLAAQVLEINDDFTKAIEAAMPKLPPMKIGKNGHLQEWYEEYHELEPGHRHVSHLLGVYPEWQINAEETPELFAAARKSLQARLDNGGGGTGWSLGWLICLWARFGEGEKAWETIQQMLKVSTQTSLLDIHPPMIFQIDGNFGTVAGMAEMLLQANEERLHLFPAMPNAWQTGEVKGLCAPRGLTLDLTWDENRNATVTFKAKFDVEFSLFVGACDDVIAEQVLAIKAGEEKTVEFNI